ncbi:MAG: glutathione S-transferase [Nitrospirae bacterium]|nr:glutathione S-transferase [Nitrospirota bacterium]
MITLYQHPASPFCIAIDVMLRYAKADHHVVNLPYSDRRLIVEKSQGQYYKIPLLEDGDRVIWERSDESQDIARYVDRTFGLDLFPQALEGIQAILARYIESDVEAVGFKLNDIYYEEWIPDLYDRTMMVRHKERKFGPGCLATWAANQDDLQRELEARLNPLDQMLSQRAFLVDERPRFVDFDLLGILGNYLYSGHYHLPKHLEHLDRWHERMRVLAG